MWLAASVWATAAADPEVPTSTIVAGVIALVSAALAAWLGARGTLRSADVQREQAHDKRVDERLAYLEQRNEQLVAQRDRYREQYVQLRIGVIAAGLDPDEISGDGDRGDCGQRRHDGDPGTAVPGPVG